MPKQVSSFLQGTDENGRERVAGFSEQQLSTFPFEIRTKPGGKDGQIRFNPYVAEKPLLARFNTRSATRLCYRILACAIGVGILTSPGALAHEHRIADRPSIGVSRTRTKNTRRG